MKEKFVLVYTFRDRMCVIIQQTRRKTTIKTTNAKNLIDKTLAIIVRTNTRKLEKIIVGTNKLLKIIINIQVMLERLSVHHVFK